MRCYQNLYAQRELDFGEEKEKKKKEREKKECLKEQEEQFIASAWMTKTGIVHNHSPAGGYRDIREAAKFRRMGVSAGFPDFEIPYARKGYHGLYIELKREFGGKLSDRQLWWRDFLLVGGYSWHEAKGAKECIRIVREYFDLIE